MKAFIALIFVIWSALSLAGQTFNNRYFFPDYSFGGGMSVEEIDNNYRFYSNIGDTLIKFAIHTTDVSGEVIDSNRFYTISAATFNGYSNTTDAFDSGVISAGSINYGDGLRDGIIVKWGLSSDTIATKKITPDGNYSAVILQRAIAVEDGFLAIGSISDGVSIERMFLVKTDFELNEVWRRQYGSSTFPHVGYSVVQTPDGGFLLGGVRKVPDSWDHCVIKTSADGTQQYLKYHGNEFKCYYAMVDNASDGNYYFGGRIQIDEYNDYSQVCKLDAELDTIWCKVYGNYGPDCRVNCLKLLPDGNVIICGMDRSDFTMYGYVAKLDPDGNQLWYRKYAQTAENWCYFQDVIQTTDDGYLLTGSLYPEVDLTQDIWGLKLDDMGCLVPGCDTLVHVPERDASWGVSIYPNPTSQFVNVYLSASSMQQLSTVSLELVDMQGRIVRQFTPHLTDTTYMMDVEDLPAGIYVLNVFADGAVVKSEKIMKEPG
ncbi:MAG: T9SS type A sorting domain-containing protein [Flavobacteriales bacterium]